MSWQNILKAPFTEPDDYGQVHPTEDTNPAIKQAFQDGLRQIQINVDGLMDNWKEQSEMLIEEIEELESQEYKAFFLKKPFIRNKIKKLKEQVYQLARGMNRPSKERITTDYRNNLATQLENTEHRIFLAKHQKLLKDLVDEIRGDSEE